jgi:hypothetical protein
VADPYGTIYQLTVRDLETIAANVGVKTAPEPASVLGSIAAAADHPNILTAAGRLFKTIIWTKPFGPDTGMYAIEAARTFLIANGARAARISVARAQDLIDAVASGEVESADEIGRRLLAL